MLGKHVFMKHARVLRFGTVVEEKTENNWKFVRVLWVDDEPTQNARKWKAKLRKYDDWSDWNRIDEVIAFQPEQLIETLKKL
jgi:hypothetical protein